MSAGRCGCGHVWRWLSCSGHTCSRLCSTQSQTERGKHDAPAEGAHALQRAPGRAQPPLDQLGGPQVAEGHPVVLLRLRIDHHIDRPLHLRSHPWVSAPSPMVRELHGSMCLHH